jgi:hypothetical protein
LGLAVGEVLKGRGDDGNQAGLLVQIEGTTPTAEQIEMCHHLWAWLFEEMDFRVASFCPALLPHQSQIMAPIIEEIPA